MTINSLKELDKLIALCRKRGVNNIKIDNIELELGSAPIKTKSAQKLPVYTPGGVDEFTKVETDELTPEQLLYYSSGSIEDIGAS